MASFCLTIDLIPELIDLIPELIDLIPELIDLISECNRVKEDIDGCTIMVRVVKF